MEVLPAVVLPTNLHRDPESGVDEIPPPAPQKRRRSRGLVCAALAAAALVLGLIVLDALDGVLHSVPGNVSILLAAPGAHAAEGTALTVSFHGAISPGATVQTLELSTLICETSVREARADKEAVLVASSELDAPVAVAPSDKGMRGSTSLYAAHHRPPDHATARADMCAD